MNIVIALRTFGTHSPRGVGIGSASFGAAQNGKGENRLVMPELVSGLVLWSYGPGAGGNKIQKILRTAVS